MSLQAELDAAKQAKEEKEASHRSELFQAQKRAATLDMQLGNAKRLLRIVEVDLKRGSVVYCDLENRRCALAYKSGSDHHGLVLQPP